ncbi:MAG: hypothetical protein JWP91_1406 [Fibrobacteres bacterium]|nr:hypothetical protein [Fibrobacterota bacterium]
MPYPAINAPAPLRAPALAPILALTLALSLTCPPARAQTLKHRFLAVDNGANKLLLVDEIGGKGWTIPIPSGSRDLQLIPGNKVLVSHGDGAAEYDLATGAKGWSVTGFSGISTARRLANGNTLLGSSDANAVTVYELNPDKTQKGKRVSAGLTDLRLLRPLDNGNILLSLASPHKVVEVNAAGATVWTAGLTDKAYVAVRLANGHTIATSGEDARVYDISVDGKSSTLAAAGLEKFPNSGLLWFSGFEILPNGHYFVANWNGHGMEGKGPHAVEFDAANNLVWKWEDHVAASTVTNVLTFETGTTSVQPRSDITAADRGSPGGLRILQGRAALGGAGLEGFFLPDGRILPLSK